MSDPVKETKPEQKVDEQKMVKMYMDLTGCTEASARSVVMGLEKPEAEESGAQPGSGEEKKSTP